MDNVSIIAAIGKNNELGKDNNLIWRFKEDLKSFKEYTMGKPMIMGYNTFYSLRGGSPLPGRKHIVLTNNHGSDIEKNEQIVIVHNMEELLEYIETYKDEIMVIGGASLYAKMLKYAKKMILTEINAEEKADVFFPDFNKDEWNQETVYEACENGIEYKRKIYIRK